MIILDASETRESSLLPNIQDSIVSPNLEEISGADVMVSPLQAPANSEALIKMHLEEGACLIQVKILDDLVHSTAGRLSQSIARMRALTNRSSQCVLLSAGIFAADKKGKVLVGQVRWNNEQDKRYVHFRYPHGTGFNLKGVKSALRRWTHRGGVVIQLNEVNEIPEWLHDLESDLTRYSNGDDVKVLWPESDFPPDPPAEDDVLQQVVPVSDRHGAPGFWRPWIACMGKGERGQGIGPHRANKLWEYMCSIGMPDEPLVALLYAIERGAEIEGWGPKSVQNLRAWLNLSDDMSIDIVKEQRDGKEEKDQ